jgi:hypothetical protein
VDKLKFKFSIPKLPNVSNPKIELLLDPAEDNKLKTCTMRYDQNRFVDVPQVILTFETNSSHDAFVIPVAWNRFDTTCEIEIGFTSQVHSAVALQYNFPSDSVKDASSGDFWVSEVFTLESEHNLTLAGCSGKVIVEFMDGIPLSICENSREQATKKNPSTMRRWGPQPPGTVWFEIDKMSSSRTFFIKTKSTRIRVYSTSATPIEVAIGSKRKVILAYEECKESGEIRMGEPLPEWNGKTVIYRGDTDFAPRAFLKVADSITHVRIPICLDPIQQNQVAILFGVSLEGLQHKMKLLGADRELAVA